MASVDRLGDHRDAYADLVSNGAEARQQIADNFSAILKGKTIPDITMAFDSISVGSKARPYYFVRHSSGALMTIALREYGSDLLIKWDLWFKGRLNIAIVAICGVLAIIGLLLLAQGFPTAIFGFALIVVAAVILIGMSSRGKLYQSQDFLSAEDLVALKLVVNSSLQTSIDQAGLEHKLRELLTPALSAEKTRII